MGKSRGAATTSGTSGSWEDKDSLDELDEATLGNSVDNNNNGSGAPKNQTSVYSESANADAALRWFGIRFTTKQYHTTKLLKFSVMPMPCIICTKRYLSGDALLNVTIMISTHITRHGMHR
jgi:hypothetical protein